MSHQFFRNDKISARVLALFACLLISVIPSWKELNLYFREEILDSESIIFETESEFSSPALEEYGIVFGEKQAEGVEEDWE
jgi:hypothetical protein